MATKEEAQGTWNQLAGAVKTKYSQITGDDLASVKGNIQQLAGVIQKKTGKAREEIDQYLQSISGAAASTAEKYSDAASDMANKASESIREGYDYAKERSRDGLKAASETIQHRPGQSLVLALGIGVAVGLIVGSSLRGKKC